MLHSLLLVLLERITMTLEQLLDYDSAKLESLSDKQLNDFFAPYFAFTRPSEAQKMNGQAQSRKHQDRETRISKDQKAMQLIEMFSKKFGDKLV